MHQMHSKWLDVGMDIAAFHLQSARYNSIKPPAFGENPHLTSLERERERLNEPTREEVELQIDETLEKEKETQRRFGSRFSKWRLRKRKSSTPETTTPPTATATTTTPRNNETKQAGGQGNNNSHPKPQKLHRRTSLDQRIKQTTKNINAPPKPKPAHKKKRGRGHRRIVSAIPVDTHSPLNTDPDALDERPLFLQEAAHLLSLLSAVAFSTLRNDLEHAESPLITFTPGKILAIYNMILQHYVVCSNMPESHHGTQQQQHC